jgi:hypothetical protein
VTTAAFAALWVAAGFGAAVWSIIGFSMWEQNPWRSAWNFLIAAADLVAAVVIGARLVGHPIDLLPGVSTLLLLPIIVIPPALKLRDWFTARSLQQRERIGDD